MTVYKVVEVVATSNTSFSDAVRGAVQRAAATLDDLEWFEVKELGGRIAEGVVQEFEVKLDLGFAIHAPGTDGRGPQPHRRGPTRESASTSAQHAASEGVRRAPRLAHGHESHE